LRNAPLLLPAHALSVSVSGAALATPFCRLVGTLALPFKNNRNASYGDTTVPLGAPVAFRKPDMPLPAQRTLSVEWHAPANKSKSAWHARGQLAAVACRHGGSGLMTPPTTATPLRAALCVNCATWSKAAPHSAAAYGRAAWLSQELQSPLAFTPPIRTSRIS
jgi:hypothetical protein